MVANQSQRQALLQLGAANAEAVARALESLTSGPVDRGDVSVTADGSSPFVDLPERVVAASASFVGGATGANILVLSLPLARALAGAMGTPVDGDDALAEAHMTAVGAAAGQMLAAAAAATSVVIGQEIEISAPDVRLLEYSSEMGELYGGAPYCCSTTFTIAGESARLIQLVPSAFVVRMARGIEERSLEGPALGPLNAGHLDANHLDAAVSVSDALTGTHLRVWAELGRAQMALGQALELPVGALVELDRATDAPVDLFVNGLCFGHGRLLVTEDGEWAIEIESVSNASLRQTTSLAFAGIAGLSEPGGALGTRPA